MSLITWAILIFSAVILVFGGITVFGMVSALSGGEDVRDRLDTFATVQEQTTRRPGGQSRRRLTRLRMQVNAVLSVLASEQLTLQLISANWPITEVEYILIRFWSVVLSFFLGWLVFQNIYPGIGLAIIAFMIPPLILRRSIMSRRTAFERQLVDVLVILSGAVRSGYSLPQAMEMVVREMRAPASEEFRRVIYEVGLGLSLSKALNNLYMRMANDDLYLVVTAININYQVGGNMVTMLDAVTKTIRDRVRLFSEVRALTAQQRFSSYILSLLPIAFVGIMFVMNPKYIMKVFVPGITLCFPIGALISVMIGNVIIRRLTKIDV
jgi:tight adherence protein B